MPIKKRLTEKQRIKKQLPKGWKSALRHPLMQKICYKKTFDPTASNVIQAIKLTSNWRGASWAEKVFTLALDIILEKSTGTGVLATENYNRLQDHLEGNDTKMYSADMRIWMVWCWDIYHDHYKLYDIEPGALVLETPKLSSVKKRRKKLVIKRTRK